MTTLIATHTQSIFSILAKVPNPFRVLRAMEQLSKFRTLDAETLRDMGLTPEHAQNATLSDFLATPHG